ncbi:hypothetical protein ACFFRR_008035 [Megaselia abdita]
MRPVLYIDKRSPPVRACLMLARILKIDLEYKEIDLFKGEQNSEEFLKVSRCRCHCQEYIHLHYTLSCVSVSQINKSHTVPSFQDDKITLTDSHSILIYLCEQYGGDGGKLLYPSEDRLLRTKVINQLFFESSILFRRDSDMMSEIIRKGFSQVDILTHERKITECYDILDRFLENSKYVVHNEMTIADLSVVTTLSTVDLMFRVTEDKWRHLFKWFARMKSLPEYSECNTVGLNHLKETMERFGKFKFPQ